ncbi:hypothetical protein Tco_1508781 [Tanacetum coccineum]
MENPKVVKDKEVESNINILHGFKNVVKVGKGVSHSPSSSRKSKCLTSFGNFKTKDKKGFSFIDEMHRMIEVGDELGYDVKGYKSSLRKKINGIGLKAQLKRWYSRTKDSEYSKKKSILDLLRNLDEKINAGHANEEDRDLRVNTLLELDGLEKLESMDLIQKSQIK